MTDLEPMPPMQPQTFLGLGMDVWGSLIRHALSSVFATLGVSSYFSQNQTGAIASGLMLVLPVVWSVAQKLEARKR